MVYEFPLRTSVLALAVLAVSSTSVPANAESSPLERGLRKSTYDSPRGRLENFSLRGLGSKEVIKQLGTPDRKEKSGKQDRWVYGRSAVFFTDGVISGWSNLGELNDRLLMHSLGRVEEDDDPAQPEGWETSWRRQKRLAPEDVVDELLKN